MEDAIGRVADMEGETPGEFREYLKVLLGDLLTDGVLVSWVDECHAAAFETGAAETTAVDALSVTHYII